MGHVMAERVRPNVGFAHVRLRQRGLRREAAASFFDRASKWAGQSVYDSVYSARLFEIRDREDGDRAPREGTRPTTLRTAVCRPRLPFDCAQGKPFDCAQGKPFDGPRKGLQPRHDVVASPLRFGSVGLGFARYTDQRQGGCAKNVKIVKRTQVCVGRRGKMFQGKPKTKPNWRVRQGAYGPEYNGVGTGYQCCRCLCRLGRGEHCGQQSGLVLSRSYDLATHLPATCYTGPAVSAGALRFDLC